MILCACAHLHSSDRPALSFLGLSFLALSFLGLNTDTVCEAGGSEELE